jgi:hypothetical protein
MSTERSNHSEVEISATVKARELYFERVPETEVRFPGRPERESASGTDRVNLPDEVEPGVTYCDPEIRLRIASALVEESPELQKWAETGQETHSENDPTNRRKR